MNAISSGINKGAVKVAPKAGGSRRSRQQQTRIVAQTSTYVGVQKESAIHPTVDHKMHSIENLESTKGAVSRAIPVVGRSMASNRDVSLNRRRQNDDDELIDSMQPTAALSHKFMHRTITDEAGVTHEPASVDLEDSQQSTQAKTNIPADISGISIREKGTRSTISTKKNGLGSIDSIIPQTDACIDKSDEFHVPSPSVAQFQAVDPATDSPHPVDMTEQQLQGGPRRYKRSRRITSSRSKIREVTPEHAQFEVIDASDVRMLDLCKDLRKGRKSTKYEQFKLLADAKKRRRVLNSLAGQASTTTAVDAEVDQNIESSTINTLQESKSVLGHEEHETKSISDQEDDELDDEDEQQVYLQEANTTAPQVRIVDGKIVLDVGSLQVDRSARDAAGSSAIEYVEEDPLEKTVNSRSYSKHKLTPRWDALGTELFYTGLSQWGTDFDMISRMFPTRTRKQIKNKFTIEEKKNPTLVTRALLNKEPVDMQEYSRISEIEFRSVAELEQDLNELKSRFAKEREEALEEAQQRKIEAQNGSAEAPLMDAPRKKRHRGVDSGIEVVGDIEEVEEEERRAAARAAASSEGEEDDDDDGAS